MCRPLCPGGHAGAGHAGTGACGGSGGVLAVQDTQSRRYTGRVVSPATVSLVPRVAGEILEVGFRDGDTVQAGQMLYRIDPVRYEAAVKNARGKVVQYKAEHAYARADLARNRSLFKKQAVKP
ncbi:efflux RND transporter periplasmic adaptor subunit [Desulfovibrio sp. SGI.102]|uniref:efflux RND transporter periplasmic adaptor subunit n=1 Tax=Desulfovibrio sp. SGI.102 TaxID=3420559 RepID=UPI003D02462C